MYKYYIQAEQVQKPGPKKTTVVDSQLLPVENKFHHSLEILEMFYLTSMGSLLKVGTMDISRPPERLARVTQGSLVILAPQKQNHTVASTQKNTR